MNPDNISDGYEQQLIANIREHGCQVTHVFDPDGEQPGFSYSIGFTETLGQPEVIIFGLNANIMHFMINQTLRNCREGLVLQDWTVVDGLLEGHHCIARTLLSSRITREHFNSAMWYHRLRTGQELTAAVQLSWPGAVNKLFPWDDGCSAEVRALQPALYEPESDA